ncbi:hypothetical protein F511_10728 [Dorcoceras hygrometricum]|uniref:Uncharacterized protein n=1 Tax=Dorcoceras hygrometricum TaxID=472368 RepID=A0A2Z7CB70_9LAMI|nr:hypothetical protein F511_10728 [Dorcoceras hygrometricum]
MIGKYEELSSVYGRESDLDVRLEWSFAIIEIISGLPAKKSSLRRSTQLRTVNSTYDGQHNLGRSTKLRMVNSTYAQRRKNNLCSRRKNILRSRKEKHLTLKEGKIVYAQRRKNSLRSSRKNSLPSRKKKQLTLREGKTAYGYNLRSKRENSLRSTGIETWLGQSPIHVRPLVFLPRHQQTLVPAQTEPSLSLASTVNISSTLSHN